MKHLSLSLLLISFLLIFSQCKKDDNTPGPVKYDLVQISTDSGNILIWLYEQTPIHKTNFMTLTGEKYYDSVIFYYVKSNDVIKSGDPNGDGTGGKSYLLAGEFNDSITNVYGAVGAVMNTNPQKSTHGSQFYIVVNKAGAHSLDKTYSVFGQVIDGMHTAVAISVLDRDLNNKPLTNIYMKKVEIVKYTEDELKTKFNFKIPTF